MSGDFLLWPEGGAVGTEGVESRDVAKHPATHRTAPYDKEFLASVNSATAEKPSSMH